MSIADSVFSAIPGVRRWWWRHKWTTLDVPADEWAKLDEFTENLYDAMQSVKRTEEIIMEASMRAAGHGMNTRINYSDASGKDRSVEVVLDGTGATEAFLQGYHKQLDAQRLKMMKLAVKLGNWAADNVVPPDYPDKAPLHTRIAGFVRNVKRIALELSAAREGRTPEEFLRYALLDKEARAKRLCVEAPPERMKLEKPAPEKKPKPKPEKNAEAERRREIAALLPQTFYEHGVDVQWNRFIPGRAVTRYKLKLERGQKLKKAENIADEVALRLGVDKVAISKSPDEAQTIFVDVPNKDVKPLLYKDAPREDGKLFVGESIEGRPVFTDMESLCHVLIAGTTGSGKSTFLNTLICSLIQAPATETHFIMIDPKMVELTPYNGIPHLTRPVVTDAEKAAEALDEAAAEMDNRYRLFMESGVKKLAEYNEKGIAPFPRLVVVIDELADLMVASEKDVEASIIRIATKGRAAGIHLVIATQRPTKDVITGQIKANIPSRIAFAVASAMESRIILDESGAEKLCGKGDMIYKPVDGKAQRLQGAYISNEDIERIVKGANNVHSQSVRDADL